MTRKINALEAAADIRSNMADSELMDKYHLSPEELDSLRESLKATKLLVDGDQDIPLATDEEPEPETWMCISCGKFQNFDFDECPECGSLVDKTPPETPSQEHEGEEEKPDAGRPTVTPPEEEPPVDQEPPQGIPTPWDRVKAWLRKPLIAIAVGAVAMFLFISIYKTQGPKWGVSVPGLGSASSAANPLTREIEASVLAYYVNKLPRTPPDNRAGWRLHDLRVAGLPRPGRTPEEIKGLLDHKEIYCVCLRSTWLFLEPNATLQTRAGFVRIPSCAERRNADQLIMVLVQKDGRILVSPVRLGGLQNLERMENLCGRSPCQGSPD